MDERSQLLATGRSSAKEILPPPAKTPGFDYLVTPRGAIGKVNVYCDVTLGPPGFDLAERVLNRVSEPYRHMEVFFGIQGDPVDVVIARLGAANNGDEGAYHHGNDFGAGGGARLYLDATFSSTTVDPVDFAVALFVAELSECFMGKQGKGWGGGGSNLEALSRFLAAHETPDGAFDRFKTGPKWAAAGRPDWITTTYGKDDYEVATGCGVVYLYWMLLLGFTIPQIVQAGGDTLEKNYKQLTGKDAAYATMMLADLGGLPILSDNPFGARLPLFGNPRKLAVTVSGASLTAYHLGTDHAIWSAGPSPTGQGWSPWLSLGLAGGGFASDPAIAVDAGGREHVFVRAQDGALWRNIIGGGTGPGWDRIGDTFKGNPAAAATSDGVAVFSRGLDNALWRIAIPDGRTPSAPLSLGGDLGGDPVVARHSDGRLEAFARGRDDALWHAWETTAGGAWSGWTSHGGSLASDPCVIVQSGRLDVFFRGAGDRVWHFGQTEPPAGPWSTVALAGMTAVGAPFACANSSGQIEVFCRGRDRFLWHVWQETPGDVQWSDWTSLGGINTGDPTGVLTPNGLSVLARGSDYCLWEIAQSAPSQPWAPWTSHGGHLANRPA